MKDALAGVLGALTLLSLLGGPGAFTTMLALDLLAGVVINARR